ncbi:MAG: hypothetical protein J6V06_00365 [Clostridia bacterium]|nr:hypothetical protein [Clostridia bacterium]
MEPPHLPDSSTFIHKFSPTAHNYSSEVIILFAILQISENNTILRKPEIKSQRVNLPSGDAFFIVTTDNHMGKVPWKRLERCIGILRHCMLLPEDIPIPDGINITAFTPEILPKLLLINSATDYIKNQKEFFRSKSIAVFDRDGIYQAHIQMLIPYLKNIRVITDKIDMYNSISEKLMADYGFSLVVSDKDYFDCNAVISHKCDVPVYFSGTVFTSEKKYLMNAEVLLGSEIELPDEYENLCPENIDIVLFASVLYEKCGEKCLGKLRYKDFGC